MLTTEQRSILLDLVDPDGGEVDLLTRQHNAIDAALAELDALRAAGDALAEACAILLEDAAESAERETTGMKRAYPALAGWAAARGGSGGEATPESEDNP